MSDELAALKQEVLALRKELTELKADADDTGKALLSMSKSDTKHYQDIYQYIADIHMYLMPVVHKVFPNYDVAKRQIDEFMERYSGSKNPKKSD